MMKPETKSETKHEPTHVAVRLDKAVVARVDARAPRLSEPWGDATRSEVLRALLLTALADAEQDPERFAIRWRVEGELTESPRAHAAV
jgi:hypothetical protein